MSPRDCALRALRNWILSHGDGAVPLAGEHHDRTHEVAFDPKLVAAVEAEIALSPWQPIAGADLDHDRVIFARTEDGRVMLWRTTILAAAMQPRTPEHLKFPATEFMEVPE